MRVRHYSLTALLAIIAWPAAAAVTVRYAPEAPDAPSLVIEADDNGNVRAEDSNGQLLIIRGSETWVSAPPAQDRVMVRMEDAIAVAREAQVAGPAVQIRHQVIERGSVRVGQWQGQVFWIDPVPPASQAIRTEYVISADPALAEAARAYARMEAAYAEPAAAMFANGRLPTDFAAQRAALLARGLTLRVTGFRRLESVTEGPIPLARFTPARVISRDEYRSRIGR